MKSETRKSGFVGAVNFGALKPRFEALGQFFSVRQYGGCLDNDSSRVRYYRIAHLVDVHSNVDISVLIADVLSFHFWAPCLALFTHQTRGHITPAHTISSRSSIY